MSFIVMKCYCYDCNQSFYNDSHFLEKCPNCSNDFLYKINFYNCKICKQIFEYGIEKEREKPNFCPNCGTMFLHKKNQWGKLLIKNNVIKNG